MAAGVRAATDVTGFGLLGHLYKMCRASGVGAVIDRTAVPLRRRRPRGAAATALSPAGRGATSTGCDRTCGAAAGVTEDDLLLLADAQTSGGLLVVGELPGYPVIGHTVAGQGIEIR